MEISIRTSSRTRAQMGIIIRPVTVVHVVIVSTKSQQSILGCVIAAIGWNTKG